LPSVLASLAVLYYTTSLRLGRPLKVDVAPSIEDRAPMPWQIFWINGPSFLRVTFLVKAFRAKTAGGAPQTLPAIFIITIHHPVGADILIGWHGLKRPTRLVLENLVVSLHLFLQSAVGVGWLR
jgi:hypothetical protein